VSVLVTRPAHQAGRLIELIEQAGGQAVSFPVLEIGDPPDPVALQNIIARLDEFGMAIFISPNAVTRLMERIGSCRALPPHLKLACVGQGSARALQQLGCNQLIAPTDRFDSEALLALPPLRQVQGMKIVIFRGNGGRELLGDTLRQRGAQVEYAECYRRSRPSSDSAPLIARWAQGGIQMISVTSTQGLRNLHEMLGETGRKYLIDTPIVVISRQTAAACRELGMHKEPLLAEAASDDAIVAAIKTWRATQNSL
jgi:uroporphyrinogen-III synthase